MACCNRCNKIFFTSGFKTYTWQRLSKALFTSKEGFSVVAPINVIIPFSTAPSKASCWPLLKRCISSIKRMNRVLFLLLQLLPLLLLHRLMALSVKKGTLSVCGNNIGDSCFASAGRSPKNHRRNLPFSMAVRRILPLPVKMFLS